MHVFLILFLSVRLMTKTALVFHYCSKHNFYANQHTLRYYLSFHVRVYRYKIDQGGIYSEGACTLLPSLYIILFSMVW